MTKLILAALVPCLWLSIAFSKEAQGSGELVPADDYGCWGSGPENATFTPTRFTYVSAGSCTLARTRLNLNVTVHWTGVGNYDPRMDKQRRTSSCRLRE